MFSRIGIALAAYQPDPKYFFEQLASIQAQTYTEWDCYVSSDSPLDAFRKNPDFARFFEDRRFHWGENPLPLGHLKNFEKAIQSVLTYGVDAVACCDQDDIWYSGKLEKSLAELNRVGPLSLVFSDMKVLTSKGAISEKTAWQVERRGVEHCGSTDLLIRNVVAGTGMLMDAELAKRFPKIPEAARFHDHWYPLVASRLGKVVPIFAPLYSYRIHGNNVVGVTPYRGLFARDSKERILEKCAVNWRKSRDFALAADQSGLKLSALQKFYFLTKWDFGVGLFFFGLTRLFGDPALARAAFARALGKFSSTLKLA
jgi:hypothetical protein